MSQLLQADSGEWKAEVAIRQEAVQVEGWALPHLPPLITDILISLDDKWLFFSNWLRGDVCQYDIRCLRSLPLAPPLIKLYFILLSDPEAFPPSS
jgi:hypothetical protein